MKKTDLKNINSKEMVPGFHAKFIHSENMTLAYWDIKAGSSLPEHSHINEQVLNLLEGEFEFFDCHRQKLVGNQKLVNVKTICRGKLMESNLA